MYACPWCERKSFSFWQKQSLGPSRALTCKGCRRKVSVPWGRAHIAALPLFLCTVAGMWIIGEAFGSRLYALGGALAGLVIGMLLMMPLYHFIVPLIRPEPERR